MHRVNSQVVGNTFLFSFDMFCALRRYYPGKESDIMQMSIEEMDSLVSQLRSAPETLCYLTGCYDHPLGVLDAKFLHVLLYDLSVSKNEINRSVAEKLLADKELIISVRCYQEEILPQMSNNSTCLKFDLIKGDLWKHERIRDRLINGPLKELTLHDNVPHCIVERMEYEWCTTIVQKLEDMAHRFQHGDPNYWQSPNPNDPRKPYKHLKTNPEIMAKPGGREKVYKKVPGFPEYKFIPTEQYQEMNTEQRIAYWTHAKFALGVVQGKPGTGKSTYIIRNIVQSRPRWTYLVTTAWGAAANRTLPFVKGYADSVTMAKIVSTLRHKKNHPWRKVKGLIVDEASTADERLFYEVLCALPHLQQLILVGDVNQLFAIGKGFPFRDFIEKYKKSDLCTFLVHNFRVDSDASALTHNAS